MMDNNTIPAEQYSFKDFLFNNRRNRITLILAAVAIVIQFGVFKYFYPFASFIHGDSFSYLDAAYRNFSINTYLIGYSNFLRLFSVFTKSDLLLTTFQYILIQTSAFLLVFTIFYFYKPIKVIQILLLSFIILNPLFLYLGNLISSDGYFLSLSLSWFTLLLWIMHRPSKWVIIMHGIILFLAFTTRYNAMIYPIVSAGAFWLSKLPIRQKIGGLTGALILCGLFVGFTSYKYKILTNHWQYSPFSGWQWANNAMYAYRYVDSIDRKPVPQKFYALDNMIRKYFDSTRDINKYPTEGKMASTYYMWSPGMPLMKYRDSLFKNDTSSIELKKWATMGPLFKDYGIYTIKQYPWHFARYFLWPNANKYYAPPVEYLQSYNSMKDSIPLIAKVWFGYKSFKISSRLENKKVWVLDYYPILSGVINIVMICCLFCYALLKGWQYRESYTKGVLLGSAVWLLNATFTIFASSVALRFQSFPIILTTIYAALLLDWIIQLMTTLKMENKNAKSHITAKDDLNPNLFA
jgi:hypothetical protein